MFLLFYIFVCFVLSFSVVPVIWKFLQKLIIGGGGGGGGAVKNVHVFFKTFSIKEVHTCRIITKNVADYLI